MVDHIADEVDQMILGQPFTQARRKQKPLFWKVRTVALAHDPLCTTAVPVPPAQSLLSTVGLSQTHLTSPTDYFSDTLLVERQLLAKITHKIHLDQTNLRVGCTISYVMSTGALADK